MNLRIAGLICNLDTDNHRWKKFLEKKYGFFKVSLHEKPLFNISIVPQVRINHDVIFFKESGKVKILTPLNLRRFRTFNFFLKTSLAYLLLNHQGFLLHASSLTKDSKGFIFTGKQGSGKSTVVKLAKNYQALNDDFTIIKKDKGKYFVFSSPFYETNPIPQTKIKAPIKGVYFLTQANENRLVKMEKDDSIIKIISLILTPLSLPSISNSHSKKLLEKLWRLANDFVQNNPCYMLYFKKDSAFLELLKCN